MTQPGRAAPEVAYALLGAAAMIAAHVAGRASRDALFLTWFDATDLPKMMIGSALFSIASAFALSHWLGRLGPGRVVPLAFGLSALLLVGEWALVLATPEMGAVVLYLHIALFGAVLISGFWSVINERFDPYAARRTIGRITAAAAAGGVLGGVSAERLSAVFGLPTMLLVIAGLHGLCALSILVLRPSETARGSRAESVGIPQGMRALRDTPYLQQMMVLVALVAATETLLDYAVKFEADALYDAPESLVRFFAVFYTLTGIAAFLIQASIGTRVLRRFGLGAAMLSLPVFVATAGLVATAVTRLWTVAVTRGLAMVAGNSLFRSGFELLYTPLSPATKRPTKIFVDIGAQRGGDLLASGAILAALAFLPALPVAVVVGCAVACAAGSLVAVRSLERGYVLQLAGSLRAGQVSFEDPGTVDATTAKTIAATRVGLDREEILKAIRARQDGAAPLSDQDAPPLSAPDASVPAEDSVARSVVESVAELYSADSGRVRGVLRSRATDPRFLVAHAVPLLETDLVEDVVAFLRRSAPRAAGQIVDWMLDPELAIASRVRLARLLEDCNEPRALEGLERLLGARPAEPSLDEFELRFHAAQSAARIVARSSDRALPARRVQDLALAELRVDSRTWERQGSRQAGENRSVLLDAASLGRVDRSVEHVFTLLGLAGEREVMASTLAALYGEDPNLRGTALEYLDLTLPEDLGAALRPRLDPVSRPRSGETPPATRERSEIADELMRSTATLVIDREQLRRS